MFKFMHYSLARILLATITFGVISYHLYNSNVKNTHGGVLLLVKLQANKSKTPPWVFFTFFKLYIWYQIVQNVKYGEYY